MLEIKVLGTGCPNCIRLEELCREVTGDLGIEASIEKITDLNAFGNYNVFLTPGLVVNGKVLSQGKLPTKTTLLSWLLKAAL
ncbi:MAG: thioredoxin family protein [Bacteroidales bacterium]|jgi:small redox-active disulfide protein 2|nr:thioredoxin family protein [Bacteroidales bacterium]